MQTKIVAQREIIHIPGCFVKPSDPREQDVSDDKYARWPTDEEVEQARLETERERAALLNFPKPHVLALRGTLPADHCAACGEPMALHYDSSGAILLGCPAVLRRKRIAGLIARPLTTTEQYSVPWPQVADAVDAALSSACGWEVTTFYQGLTASARLNFSRRIAEIAVQAFKQSEGL